MKLRNFVLFNFWFMTSSQRKKQKEPPIDWNTFVVYGLVKNGLAAFEAARAEYEASSRLVLSADEVRARAGRNR